MLPFNERARDQSKKETYRTLYGNYVTNAITILNQNDIWITQEDEDNQEGKLQKFKLIETWKDILWWLRTEDFQKS
jgi:hypothetical protein